MTTATTSINLGSKTASGARNQGQVQPGGTADLVVTINTATITTRGDFMEACKQAANHLSGYLK